MLKKCGKISVLTMIAALFVFAFAAAAYAEEADEELLMQPVEMEAPELPVGGWAPAEPIYVPTDLVVNGGSDSDKIQSSKNRINADPDSVFTKGAAKTGYNALTDGQKQLYNAIDAVAVDFVNAEKDLQPTEVTMNGEDVDRYIIGTADYSKMDIPGDTVNARKQNALKAFYAYDYDHPAYYWISNEVLFNENCVYPCTEKEYATVGARRVLDALVSDSVKAYASMANTGTTTLDKIALVHDKIINDIDYAYDSDGTTPNPARWAHGVHGVFDPEHKSAVCEGYADAFALIMNYMEIPNFYIVGNAGASGPGGGSGHAWNAVYDDAAERYLYMDLTWDDAGEKGYNYAYFGMPMTNFEEEHHEYKANATEAKKWLYNIDGTYNDSVLGTYYNRGGFFYTDGTDANAFAEEAKAKAARAGGWVSVMCASEENVVTVAQALGVNASYYIAKYKDDEGENYNYAYLMAPVGGSHTHAWADPVYIWEPDNSKVTAYRICTAPNCDVIVAKETAGTTFRGTEPTCTKAGEGNYEAAFENAAFTTQSKEGTIKALGHNWGSPTYEWADDNSKVTAKRVCSHQTGDSCTETETAKTTAKVTRAATYTAKGQTTYTAAFENTAFKASKVLTNIPMLVKKTNPMKVTTTTWVVRYYKLKKSSLTVRPLKVTSARGIVTYKVVGGTTASKKALKLNTKTGKITVKKYTKKGRYQIRVKVTAAGTTAYKALSRTRTVTVKVK